MEIQEVYLLHSMHDLIPSQNPEEHISSFLGWLHQELDENQWQKNEIPAELTQAICELAKLVARLIKDEAITLSEEYAWYLPLDERIFE